MRKSEIKVGGAYLIDTRPRLSYPSSNTRSVAIIEAAFEARAEIPDKLGPSVAKAYRRAAAFGSTVRTRIAKEPCYLVRVIPPGDAAPLVNHKVAVGHTMLVPSRCVVMPVDQAYAQGREKKELLDQEAAHEGHWAGVRKALSKSNTTEWRGDFRASVSVSHLCGELYVRHARPEVLADAGLDVFRRSSVVASFLVPEEWTAAQVYEAVGSLTGVEGAFLKAETVAAAVAYARAGFTVKFFQTTKPEVALRVAEACAALYPREV